MASKLFYTSAFGKASGDIVFVKNYVSGGLYYGTRMLATPEHLAAFYEQLHADKVDRPHGNIYCSELVPISFDRVALLWGDTAKPIVDLLSMYIEPVRVNSRPRCDDRLYYVGKDMAGRLSAAHSWINTFDRRIIRQDLVNLIHANFQPLYRNLGYCQREIVEAAQRQN